VVGLVAATCTWWKTVLYFVMVTVYGWHKIVPSSAMLSAKMTQDFLLLFLIPNGIWLVVPLIVMITLGQQLTRANTLV
jgi:hypothetical protein